MKKFLAIAMVSALAGYASAAVYTDGVGDTFFGGHMDIVSVEVLNDLNDITFSITVAANNPGWGNYMMGIDTAGGGSVTNPWTRPIGFTADPIEYWAGSWTDGGGGAQLWSYDGANWNAETAPGYSFGTTNITFVIPLADLGLSVNDTFTFDVFSSGTGGGDGALDSLNDPNQTIADWGNAYEANLSYQYTVVPEPAAFSLFAIGAAALAVIRRRRV